MAALAFVVGAGLLYLTLPRTIAAIVKLPGSPVLARIQDRKPVGAEDLATLITARRRALSWADSGRDHAVLGLAQLLLARGPERASGYNQAGGYDQRVVGDAIGSLRDGLALAPASPHAWARLAYAELVANGPSAAVATALDMSLRTAPFEPRLLRVRVELSLHAWPYLTAEVRRLVHEQIRQAWRQSRSQLIVIARYTGRENVVRRALSEHPAARAEFEQLLRSIEG